MSNPRQAAGELRKAALADRNILERISRVCRAHAAALKFPVDAPKAKVIKAFEALGFCVVREGNHVSYSAAERRSNDT